jgi:Xaa-Pro aminopeptidase
VAISLHPLRHVLRLENALGGYSLHDATDLLEPVRMIKAPEEVALIRRAIAITEASIAATFGQLAAGMTERDVARLLSREMQTRGASGGGLVQFGPSSALPHGGPGGAPLAPETVVLIDAGSSVNGYTSDITRTPGSAARRTNSAGCSTWCTTRRPRPWSWPDRS